MYMPYYGGSSKVLLYFHGNAVDLGMCREQLLKVKDKLKVTIIAMEYPGYGPYEGEADSN